MTTKPILFSTPMVQAILEDRKTQTRRKLGININHNAFVSAGIWTANRIWNSEVEENPNPLKTYASFIDKKGEEMKVLSKYQKGDILWVRETLYQNGELGLEYVADGECIDETIIPQDFNVRVDEFGHYKHCMIPSIYMPKFACRIFLEVTDVRVERLHDVSEEDAINEGISSFNHGYGGSPVGIWYKDYVHDQHTHNVRPRESFFSLWESINGKESRRANPWVWVFDFKRVEKPENF